MSTFCCSDIHGNYEIFQFVKEYLEDTDKCYVLGDCADRGKHGWPIIKEVLDDPRFIYIKGNHEDMLCAAMRGDRELCFYNGGRSTYNDWKYKDGGNMSWHARINKLPLAATYINERGQEVILTHSGFTPGLSEPLTDFDYLWNRHHFTEPWNEKEYPETYLVHGHTPIIYLDEYLDEENVHPECNAYWYAGGHKIDIDGCTALTGNLLLLNLDTWQEIMFKS